MNRMFAHVLVVLMLLFAVSAYAQVVFRPTDIPSTPGTITEYYSESDAVVDLGGSGSNRFWDFTDGSTATIQTREILERGTAPFSFLFPSANSVSYGPAPFGLNDDNTWRYDEITESGWTTLGTTLDVDVFGVNIPVPIPIELSLMELPLEYGDSWGMDFSRDMTIPVSIIPIDIPIFEEIRIEVTVGGDNTCDGWGTIAVPGGELEALRVFTQIGAHVDAFGIFYIFGFPIEIPLGSIYELNAILSYSWYSPGYGEVAFAMSNPGEPDQDFTQAALIRRINLNETPEIITISATPSVEPIEIPAEGGEFGWDLSLTSAFESALHCDLWSTATFPGGDEYFIESVSVRIPANGMIDLAGLEQSVPAFVPPGVSSFNVHVGLYPNLIWAQDSFSFTKVATSTNGLLVGGWNSS
ncbi:MAG TPA: hypothetical protein ENH10_02260, partial [Bacteroidetes bacterium]|nr:hypothetical protein [Bacteroidota bacterium]HEX03964.1 hypothetical protein [Bacteroidota bacterium]